MAYLEDLNSEEERRRRTGTEGGAAPVSAGGGGAASRAQIPGSGFVNLSNYFTANKDAAQQQGEQMAEDLEGAATTAIQSDSPGEAMDVAGQIDAATTPGGLATTIQKDDPLYTGGMAGLDAYLGTRGAEPGSFQALKDWYGPLLPQVTAPPPEPPAFSPYLISNPNYARDRQDYEEAKKKYDEWLSKKRQLMTPRPGTKEAGGM